MKFGDSLYQRSVPKWAAYNVNYNEIKRLIKTRTTLGAASPVTIATQSSHRWTDLENDLFSLLKAQHDNVGLFLGSKYGELDRRLAHLDKQVRGARRSVEYPNSRPVLQARRYHALLQQAESIGEDVQALSRYASVQKTAFRKLLKKYRKWTGSLALQSRLDREVFGTGQLSLDFQPLLERLSSLTRLATQELQEPRSKDQGMREHKASAIDLGMASSTAQINQAMNRSGPYFDAVFAISPFGESSGSAIYWIHPDNLEEARVLLLRHVNEFGAQESRRSSSASIHSHTSNDASQTMVNVQTLFYDNPARFAQDNSTSQPSRIAMSVRWNPSGEASVTLSNLAHWEPSSQVLQMKRKEIARALSRNQLVDISSQAVTSGDAKFVQSYLLEHRDIKPVAAVRSRRSRYSSSSTSTKVGTWAVLDTNIVTSTSTSDTLDLTPSPTPTDKVFPHAVLEIRWEFGVTPELIRAFDDAHLAEKVPGFSLESVAIHSVNTNLDRPPWCSILERDIRKLPITTRVAASRRQGSINKSRVPASSTVSSGTSSTEGQTDSVFSATQGASSATEEDSPPGSSEHLASPTSKPNETDKLKKQMQIRADTPRSRPQRYWNEFDDGDSDVNAEDAYAIYVDPDEKFPGFEVVSHLISIVKARLSWLGRPKTEAQQLPTERSSLLFSSHGETETSDSDTTPVSPKTLKWTHRTPEQAQRVESTGLHHHHIISPRQEAYLRKYLNFTIGLQILSWLLLFGGAILYGGSGRRKSFAEVDAGVVAAVIIALVCTALSVAIVWLRQLHITILSWTVLNVSAVAVVTVGVGLLTAVIGTAAG